MELIFEIVRLIGAIAIASGLVALIVLVWRFIGHMYKEEIEVARFRTLAANLRRFVGEAKRVKAENNPHLLATAQWLEDYLQWGRKEGDAPLHTPETFMDYVRTLEAPAMQKRDDEIAKLKKRLERLEKLASRVRRYQELNISVGETMVSESERHRQEEELKIALANMFEALKDVELER